MAAFQASEMRRLQAINASKSKAQATVEKVQVVKRRRASVIAQEEIDAAAKAQRISASALHLYVCGAVAPNCDGLCCCWACCRHRAL